MFFLLQNCTKEVCKFQILPVSAEMPREKEITEIERRKNCLCEYKLQYKGKMTFSLILTIMCMYGTSTVSIMLVLKCNILRFGYRVNFRYEGRLLHSFDRFYMVTKIGIPKVSNLKLTLFQFDYNCSHMVNIEKGTTFKIPSTIKEMFDVYGKNIIPYMYLYKHQVKYYEKMVYDILDKDIGLILPKFEDREKNIEQKHQKRQIISALISGFIGLAFEGIASFLQHK